MRNIIWIGVLFCTIFLGACQDKWDNFYGSDEDERSAEATLNMYQMLQQYPKRYSKFVELLDKTGLDAYLKSNRVLTLWAPHNSFITNEMMEQDSSGLRRFVLNHMNSLAIYKTKLASKYELQTLAGKYIAISRSGNDFKVEKMPVTRLDIACTNGVIHEIGGVLAPLKNLMEYLNECGTDYTVFTDSLWAYNDTIFRPDLSFALGVNEVGQTIYDSVFVINNKLLGNDFLSDERRSITLFLPSNEVIGDMIQETRDYYEAIGREFTHNDSLSCFAWLMRGTFFGGAYENLSGYKQLNGIGGSLVRFDKQIVQTDFERCSNGVVYLYERCYMPRTKLLQTLDFVPTNMFELPQEEWSKYYTLWNGGTLSKAGNIYVNGSYKDYPLLSVGSQSGDWIDLRTLSKNASGEIVEAKMMPGKYKLTGRLYGWDMANLKLYINGEKQLYSPKKTEQFPTSTSTFFIGKDLIRMVDTVVISEQQGYGMLTIRLEHDGTKNGKTIKVNTLRFEPVGDNY